MLLSRLCHMACSYSIYYAATARLVTWTSLATSLQSVYVKLAVGHSNVRPGFYVTHLLCLTCNWLATTLFWASKPGLLLLHWAMLLLAPLSMGNICM